MRLVGSLTVAYSFENRYKSCLAQGTGYWNFCHGVTISLISTTITFSTHIINYRE